MNEKEVARPDYGDLDRINERIRKVKEKIRLLVRLLLDKKIIGEAIAKSFEETMIGMVAYEGYTIEEAKLTYKARQDLPSSAFCGPKRSYPAHDAKHVRNALARLSQFGKRLKPAVRKRILSCLKRRAKRFKIEISETAEGILCLYKWDETLPKEQRKKYKVLIEESVSHYSPCKDCDKK